MAPDGSSWARSRAPQRPLHPRPAVLKPLWAKRTGRGSRGASAGPCSQTRTLGTEDPSEGPAGSSSPGPGSHSIPLWGTPALAPKAFCGDPACPPWRRTRAEGRGASGCPLPSYGLRGSRRPQLPATAVWVTTLIRGRRRQPAGLGARHAVATALRVHARSLGLHSGPRAGALPVSLRTPRHGGSRPRLRGSSRPAAERPLAQP